MDESIFDRRLEEQLCFRLYRASNGLSKMYSRALRPFGLTFPQYLVLLALWDKEGVPVTDIGDRTGMGIGTLNPILKRMEANEWITKVHHASDKRTIVISLGEKAGQAKRQINHAILEELKGCRFEGMDLFGLMKQLELLQQQLETISNQADKK